MSNINNFFSRKGVNPLPHIHIVDIGAMDVGGDAWDVLAKTGIATITGFEPNQEECDKLVAAGHAGRHYLPYAVGDGETWPFYVCNAPFNSSLLKPKLDYSKRFFMLSELFKVTQTINMPTARLDDIEEIDQCDFLKIDTQGAELMILQNGTRTLEQCLMLQVEACFLELYENQPLFGDIDQFIRSKGFVLHQFTGMGSRPFVSPASRPEALGSMKQWIWTDAVYIRDFTNLDALTAEELIKMVFICHVVYRSVDLACHLLEAYDAKQNTRLAVDYYDAVKLKMIA